MIIHSRKANKYKPSNAHTKYMNSNGDYVPSVTNIIKVIPKDALIYWANSLGWKRKSVKRELEETARIGTVAHNTIESIITKDKNEGPIDLDVIENHMNTNYDGNIRNSIISFISWYKEHRDDIELIEVEKEMSGESYGGTCDMICKYEGKLMIFDFKTSGDFYFSMFIQLCAYVNLYQNLTGEIIEDVAVLRLDKKSGDKAKLKKLSDIKNGDIDYYYNVFEQCLNLYCSLYILENDWKG